MPCENHHHCGTASSLSHRRTPSAEEIPYSVYLTLLANSGTQTRLVEEVLIDTAAEVPWLRLLLDNVSLPEGGYILMTRVLDGE